METKLMLKDVEGYDEGRALGDEITTCRVMLEQSKHTSKAA